MHWPMESLKHRRRLRGQSATSQWEEHLSKCVVCSKFYASTDDADYSSSTWCYDPLLFL